MKQPGASEGLLQIKTLETGAGGLEVHLSQHPPGAPDSALRSLSGRMPLILGTVNSR